MLRTEEANVVRVGIVIETNEGRAQVSETPQSTCGNCAERGSCGMVLTPMPVPREYLLTVDNQFGAQVGDWVEYDLTGPQELKASALVWGLPLIGLLLGAITGAAVYPALGLGKNLAVLLGCTAGLVLAWSVMRLADRQLQAKPQLTPSILRVVTPQVCARPEANPSQQE